MGITVEAKRIGTFCIRDKQTYLNKGNPKDKETQILSL